MEALNHSLTSTGQSESSLTRPSTSLYPLSDSLFIKFQGTVASIDEASATTKEILSKHGCTQLRFAKNDAESEEMWAHRRGSLLAILRFIKDSKVWTTDVW
jgi:D-lactate dehydrogenase (cytochrome)